MQEMVSAMIGIGCGQVERLLTEMYAPDVILGIQLTEAGSTIELMRYVI